MTVLIFYQYTMWHVSHIDFEEDFVQFYTYEWLYDFLNLFLAIKIAFHWIRGQESWAMKCFMVWQHSHQFLNLRKHFQLIRDLVGWAKGELEFGVKA